MVHLRGFQKIHSIVTGLKIIWKSGQATISRKRCKGIEIPNSPKIFGTSQESIREFSGNFEAKDLEEYL
jgi:hypothetical protein